MADLEVQVEAAKLKPFTTYYYQFQVCNSDNRSPVGRTKTAPESDDKVDQINLAVYSCANFRMLLYRIECVNVCGLIRHMQRSASSMHTDTLYERIL